MPYSIDRFGDAYSTAEQLPRYDGTQPQGAGRVESAMIRLVGGAYYDALGDADALPPAEEIIIEGEWVAANDEGMQTKMAALRALRGTKSKLWRTNGAGTSHWRAARCLEVESDLTPGSPRLAKITLRFEADPTPWHGTSGDTIITLTGSPLPATITNSGNAIARDITLTVHPVSTPMTAFYLENLTTGHVSKIKYGGTVAAGHALVINCGQKSVRNNGSDDYANLSLESGHTISEWFRLAPGANSVRITKTGGEATSTMTISFYGAHA